MTCTFWTWVLDTVVAKILAISPTLDYEPSHIGVRLPPKIYKRPFEETRVPFDLFATWNRLLTLFPHTLLRVHDAAGNRAHGSRRVLLDSRVLVNLALMVSQSSVRHGADLT